MRILVYGFYQKSNLGDDLFCEAFANLFPKYSFTYTNNISKKLLDKADAVFIGGGSFLYTIPNIEEGALPLLLNKKIFYIGVGIENIHPTHFQLMKQAKLIAIRTPDCNLELNHLKIPDLVYSLHNKVVKNITKEKSILIIPNMEIVPKHTDPLWKYTAWEYFKVEFAQFLDQLIEDKYTIRFFPMCENENMNDLWAATEIVNKMKHRKQSFFLQEKVNNVSELTSLFSKYEKVITQRFHGIILSELSERPYIALHHHDKLVNTSPKNGDFISYYEINKNKLLNVFNNLVLKKSHLNIDIFNQLKEKVMAELG